MNEVERFEQGIMCGAGVGSCSEFMEPSKDGEYVRYTDYAAIQQQLVAAREALQAAEADAARYRFIRANCVREWESDMPHNKGAPSLDLEFEANGHDLDAAIDATLQRDRQP